MITWTTHASVKPGGLDLPNLEARRAIRARKSEAEASFAWLATPRHIVSFVEFKRSTTWGLLAVYQVKVSK